MKVKIEIESVNDIDSCNIVFNYTNGKSEIKTVKMDTINKDTINESDIDDSFMKSY